MGDCSICCEGFNKKKHFKITCPSCDFEMCRMCVQTYLLETTQDPHCMSCKKEWNRDFVDASCTKVFCNGKLKEHRENILFERQKCMMPSTQPLVEREILLRQAKAEEEKLMAAIADMAQRLDYQRSVIDTIRHSRVNQSERRAFVRKCPVEDCKGFLSTQWRCGVCSNSICKDCNEIKTEGHECDPGNKATVELLNKDTKSCPKCGTMIFKISGCSQMWCPDCHVAFNWRTLEIETGIIHNPHFYEFRRTGAGGGRNHGDIPCGGLPSLREIDAAVTNNNIREFHRLVAHTEAYELRWLEHTVREPDHSHMRVRYMLNELTEDAFKKYIQKAEKKLSKDRAVRDLMQMFVNTSSDILRQLVMHEIEVDECMRIIDGIIEYFNDHMKKIRKRFNQVVKEIREYSRMIDI